MVTLVPVQLQTGTNIMCFTLGPFSTSVGEPSRKMTTFLGFHGSQQQSNVKASGEASRIAGETSKRWRLRTAAPSMGRRKVPQNAREKGYLKMRWSAVSSAAPHTGTRGSEHH